MQHILPVGLFFIVRLFFNVFLLFALSISACVGSPFSVYLSFSSVSLFFSPFGSRCGEFYSIEQRYLILDPSTTSQRRVGACS
jgi:hypothetical protein